MKDPVESPPPESGAGAVLRIEVPADAAGQRIDVFLASRPEFGRRGRIKDLARAGGVLLDGRVAKPGTTLAAGQRLTVIPGVLPESAAPDAVLPPPAALVVLYEDAYVVVIDKPAGLAAHRSENPRRIDPNVADLAVAQFGAMSLCGGEDRPGVVHRLDKETSGVMVLARTDDAMHYLKAQFRARTVEKEYRAVVFGAPRFDSDWIERAIAPHPAKGDRMVVVQDGGRDAQTFYEVVERFDGFTHVRCTPKTGRTHQIRVHMTSIGHSLVGDRLYRSRNAQQRELPEGAPDPGRHCLHARRLVFEHPMTRERLAFETPIPADVERLLHWLRANRPV